jgi:hypothetical protein
VRSKRDNLLKFFPGVAGKDHDVADVAAEILLEQVSNTNSEPYHQTKPITVVVRSKA